MDLYISPFSCSFAVHVACLEAGLAHTVRYVDRQTKRTDDGRDYASIAPSGLVPALVLDDGSVLTETSAVLQYVADAVPGKRLAPQWGTRERYRLVEWLSFIATEIHRRHISLVLGPDVPDVSKTWSRTTAPRVLAHVARALADGREILVGDRFTVADAYLFWCLFVAPHGGISLDPWPVLGQYIARHKVRPSITTAIEIEAPLFARERASEPRV